MSDLLIRNFDPPKYGYREIRIHPNGRVTEVDECGLDEAVGMAEYIPPHGRLIDADAFISFIREKWDSYDQWFAEMLEARPTIIPADPEKEGET